MKIRVTLKATFEMDVAAFAADYDLEMDEDPMDDEAFDMKRLIKLAEETFGSDIDAFWEVHEDCDGDMKVTASKIK